MKLQIKNLFLASTLLVFSVSSCVSPTATKQSSIPAQALPETEKPVNPIQPNTARVELAPNSQVVHRESQIEKTELKSSEPSQEAELNDLLAEIEKEEDFSTAGFFQSKIFITRFRIKKTKSKHDVQIPKSGEFKVILREGPDFKYLDDDATDDNTIIIQMPKSNFKTYLLLQSKKNSSLQVSDDLYHVEDTLEGRLFDRWLSLGTRPIPVPSDWESPNGNDFILRFNANDIKGFYMAWYRTNDEVSSPPGIASMGPEGGTIELPGVAKVVIPAGALSNKTAIKMKEILDAPKSNLFEGNIDYGSGTSDTLAEYISPVIEMSPNNLRLNKKIAIYLKIDEERLGSNHPGIIDRFVKISNDFGEVYNGLNGELPAAEERALDTPFYSDYLGQYFMTINSFFRPEDELKATSIDVSEGSSDFFVTQTSSGRKTVCQSGHGFNLIFDNKRYQNDQFYYDGVNEQKQEVGLTGQKYCKTFNIDPEVNKSGYIPIYANGKVVSRVESNSDFVFSEIDVPITTLFSDIPNNINIRVINLVPEPKLTQDKFRDQVPHELFHLFQAGAMNSTQYALIDSWLAEGTAQAMGLWESLENYGTLANFTAAKHLDSGQQVFFRSVTTRNALAIVGADKKTHHNTDYSLGSFFLSLSHKGKYGRQIIFDWFDHLNSLALSNQLTSTLQSNQLIDILDSKLTKIGLNKQKLDFSNLYYLYTLDALNRENLFDTNPEPYQLPEIGIASNYKIDIGVNDYIYKPKEIKFSLTGDLSAQFFEITPDPSLINQTKTANISIYLDTATNIAPNDTLKKLARYITVVPVKYLNNKPVLGKPYPLIDQLTISGQKKYIKVINAHAIKYDKLLVIVPNTTFGKNSINTQVTLKAYRSLTLNSVQNTSTPGRVRFIGTGMGDNVTVYFKTFDPDKEYTSAYAEVQGEGENQYFELLLPDDVENGSLFATSQGSESNEIPYAIDLCKREFSITSIKDKVKCLQ